MFNDGIMAICLVCSGRSVGYDAQKIACADCKFEEIFGTLADTKETGMAPLKADQMKIVLQRWQFAG